MPPLTLVIIGLALALCLAVAFMAMRRGGDSAPLQAETLLLEDAIVTEPVAPGLAGRAEIQKEGGAARNLKVKAIDPCQAFERGARVRIIDIQGDLCIVEAADQEHRAR
jgi:hypothetical protein